MQWMVMLAVMAAVVPTALAHARQPANAAAPLFDARPFARGTLSKLDLSQAGQPMPATQFETPDGKPIALSAFRGRPVLVNLWATWCAPCIKEMPALDRLARQMQGRVAVVAVSQDMAGARVVTPFWQKTRLTALVPYLDKKSQLAVAYKARGLPLTILYDAQGREVARLAAPTDWDRGEGLKLVQALAGR